MVASRGCGLYNASQLARSEWCTIYTFSENASTKKQPMEKISVRLKRLMGEKGIKQTELAARSSLSQASVSRYVRGTAEPKSRELHAISKALGVSMDSWFTGLPPPAGSGEDGNWKSRATNAERKLRKLRASVLKCYEDMEGLDG